MFLRVFSAHHAQFTPQRSAVQAPPRWSAPLAYKHPERKAKSKSRAGSKDGVRACRQQQGCAPAAASGPDENPAEDYEVLSDGDVDTEFEFV
jgi:hypothetical protein